MSKPLLDIERSLMQARWSMPDVSMDVVEQITRKHNLPEIIARLLSVRNIAPDEVDAFLNPTLKSNLPSPFTLKGMEEFAAYLAQAIQDKKKIAIFGDFDVDGATSSAILYRFLKHCGITAQVYIPGRLTEGYGPNTEALQTLKNNGADIVVLLDCGTTAFDIIADGCKMGLEISVLDHHEAEDKLPDTVHLVNPKRKDDTSGLTMLAACGVTFMACVAVNAKLREAGFYKNNGIDEPPLKDWLDLVALGTVCDMVPLTGVNRLLVRQGFSSITNNGLLNLIQTAGIKSAITPYHAGFVLGPRINAGSRVDQSDLGARLLCTDDAEEAKNIAWTLHDANEKRKAIQIEMERTALDKVEAQGLDQFPVIIVDDESFHPGLSGLVAGRLKDKYSKPVCVITYAEGEGRGSGRSVPGIHIAQAFIDARNEGLLVKGGGHAMAGGFTIERDKLPAFREFICAHIQKQAQSVKANIDTVIDGVMSVQGAKPDFVNLIHNHIGPFGQEQPEPLFLFSNVRIHSADVLGESHIRTLIGDWEGGARIKAMAFKAVGTPLGDAILKNGRRSFHIVGYLKADTWNGRENVEIHIKDAAFAMASEEEDRRAV
jgi:single-stranded-DNA-specific exonuclease